MTGEHSGGVRSPVDTPGPTLEQIADARFQALTVLALIALLAVVTGLFGNVETHLLVGALGLVGGLRAGAVLRHPERYIRAPDLDAFARQVTDEGGLPAHPGESERSMRVRLLEAMERVQERVDDVQERRHTAWIIGLTLVLAPLGFAIPFLGTWSLALLALLGVSLVVQRADRLPKRRRAAAALELLERQLDALASLAGETETEPVGPPDVERPELTSGA
ncbi:MAG: hypothetical protein KJP18_05415 [Gemmatimonadetes bacterium]|nr:hypothetical protein [Gemmatimonadota bacterium]NNF37029.1 hypothetical protein [Gemmatimonadota bacterium]